MDAFFRYFAERKLVANLLTLLILLLGVSTLMTIKRDSFPDVTFGEVLISTTFPGASPEDVELKVTNEIEKELKEVVGIRDYQSWSMENVSMIHVRVDPDEDEDEVIRDIRDAVNQVTDLPAEVEESPLVTELGTSEFPMLEVGINGDLPYEQLREIARQIEKKLEDVEGVARVERFGYRDREIQIAVSPERMKHFEISLAQIVNAIGARNVQSTGGSFESYTSEQNIVTLAEFRDPLEVGEVIVNAQFTGPLIKIKDLAQVEDGYEEEKVASRINGEAAISFVAYKKSSADIIRTVDAIRAMVARERAVLPQGVEISISNDQSTYVKKRFEIVRTNGLLGLVLVLVVLSIALNLRIAFWVALGIPVAMLGATFLLPFFDAFLDSVTLTAMILVLGIIVDDAIIIAEQIYQKYEQGLSAVEAAVQGVKEVFTPVLTTMLTTVMAFVPLFFMPGILAGFVFVIPLVIILALLVSLIESTMALPAHLGHGLTASSGTLKKSRRERIVVFIQKHFRCFVARVLQFRYLLILFFVAALAAALYFAITQMKFVLFPSSSADRFVIKIETPIGSSLNATSEFTGAIEQLIDELPRDELDSYISRIGTFGDLGASERENHAAVYVNLTPYSARLRTADEIVETLRQDMQPIIGDAEVTFEIDAGGPPVGRPIEVRIVGSDDELRDKLTTDVMNFLAQIPGTKDLERDDKAGKTQLEIKLDYDALARLGISVADVAQNVRIAYDGEVATSVRYGEEDVDFRVIFSEEVRKQPHYLKQLWLPNAGGYLTALGQVAEFERSDGLATLYHFKNERAIVVTGDVDTEITSSLAVSTLLREQFDLYGKYPGMRLAIGGEAEESERSMRQLFVILAIAAVGIYCLLILLFNSLAQPLLVMLALPFGIIGVIAGFAIHNQSFGFLAMTGIIGLAGVVVNDSLVLVNHINRLREQQPEVSLREVVAQGAANRLRPILLTTASTVAGLMPLAYGLGGADPYMSPMALALAWGLLFATPLTLVLMPCLYMMGQDVYRVFRWVGRLGRA